MKGLLPSKQALVSGIVVFALCTYAYNKSATVRRLLGAAA